ncbi:MAG: hypothetical protein K0R65_2319 [Crocinitomicaceae bacterium]|jgi:copper homeostasis protein|nr:hypothetical protein [Crocinitomicaceae bacterium]
MKIELCVAEAAAIDLSQKYGFDRMELCQALECGGLTPSLALQRMALRSGVEVHVLIRCRAGNFTYTETEKKQMLEEIADSAALGVHGVVIGSLLADKTIDTDFVNIVKKNHPGLELTFHRAFDDSPDQFETMETLIQLGVKRILTSGGKSDVLQGAEQLKSLLAKASGRIEIMAGGGVKPGNIDQVLWVIKPDAIHFSGTELRKPDGDSMFNVDLMQVNEEKISALLEKIKNL